MCIFLIHLHIPVMKASNQNIIKKNNDFGNIISKSLIDLLKKSGDNYFNDLVLFLHQETGFKYVMIGTYNPTSTKVKSTHFVIDGIASENIEYILKDTPYDTVLGKNICVYPNKVQSLFPNDKELETLGIESYAGIPLYDTYNNAIGLIVLMDSHPFKNEDEIKSLLEFVKSKTELELERKAINKHLNLSQKDFISALENFQDVFFWFNYNHKNEQINIVMSPSVEKTFGYTIKEIEKVNFNDLYFNLDDRFELLSKLKSEKSVKNYFVKLKDKEDNKKYVEVDAELITTNLPSGAAFGIRGVIKDVSKKHLENKRSELAYLIAEKSQRRLVNLNLLGEFIHLSLKDILPISNLYISCIDYDKKEITFPYYKDDFHTKDSTTFSRPYNTKGFTEFIIQNKKTVIYSKKEILKIVKDEKLQIYGELPKSYIAFPLKSDGLAVGVLAIQCYMSELSLSDENIELLRFISSQIAVIVDRQMWQHKLIENEKYYRSLVENSSEIICILNHDGMIDYISESCFKILGYKPHELIGQSITEFVPISNPKKILTYRIKHPNTKEIEVIKIKSKSTNFVYLELSVGNFNNKTQLIINAKDISKKVIAEKKRKVAQQKLTSIHNIENALISEKPFEESLSEALKVISKEIYNISRLSIGLINEDKNTLEIVGLYTKGIKKIELELGTKIPLSKLSSKDSILNKKSYYEKDLTKKSNLKSSDQQNLKEGIVSYFIMPLVIKNKVIGTLNLGETKANHFNTIDESLIKEISTLFAVVLSNEILKRDLITREQELTTIFNYSNEGVLKVDGKGNITFANNRICELLGYTEEELLTFSYFDVTYEKDLDLCQNTFNFLKNNFVPKHHVEKRFISKTNKIYDCSLIVNSVYVSNKKLDYSIIYINDLTEQKKALKKVNDLQNAINFSSLVIFTDNNGIINYVNDKFVELTGYSTTELIGKSPNLLNSNFHPKEFWKNLWNTVLSGKIWRGEIRNKKKNGEIYWIHSTITPIQNRKGEITQFIVIQFDITKEKKAKTNLIKEVIEAQERERERFAMEIHDGLGQVLLASKMNLNALCEEINKLDEGSVSIYNKSMELLNNSVQEARNISHGLMSRVLTRFGLSYAMNEIVHNINTSKKLNIVFEHNIEDERFDEELEMGLYRTLQELINNIIKHSQAQNAALLINKNNNKLAIEIVDDGIGIKNGLINSKSAGIGLKNMKSRIEYLGGSFIIDEKLIKGTKINIEIAILT